MDLLTKFIGKNHSFHHIYRPHTHFLDFSPFTEAQVTQPSPFDHRTHPLYGRTGLYVSMALLTKFLGKNHSFHRITAPTHIRGTPLLSLRHNVTQPSPFDHRIHPLYGRTGLYVSMALLTKFIGKNHSFHRITAPTHILGTPPLSLRHK